MIVREFALDRLWKVETCLRQIGPDSGSACDLLSMSRTVPASAASFRVLLGSTAAWT